MVNFMTPIYFGPIISTTVGDTYGLGAIGAPIGNDYWELNGHVNDDVS